MPSLPLAWRHFAGFQPYEPLLAEMQARATAIRQNAAAEAVWLLEHEAVYTGGTSAKPHDLLAPGNVPIAYVGRGGQWTWHGPGQRVAYVMLDLSRRGQDVRALVHGLESWIIASLAALLALPVNGATVYPESGLKMAKATASLIKLQRLAFALAAGSAGMALRLILIPIWRLLMPLCHAAFMMAG